jgi:hypothetical protein
MHAPSILRSRNAAIMSCNNDGASVNEVENFNRMALYGRGIV